ncbi:hypothetical protein GOODEAATRI_015626 [Goodea atripinnis]|uniref:Uncharacterized protein n=1 Tax=Goodea atripinnis TaxID=208336 RepID=A0ABV0NV85_9TELE
MGRSIETRQLLPHSGGLSIRPQRLIRRNNKRGNGRFNRGHAAQAKLGHLIHGSQSPAIRLRAGKGPRVRPASMQLLDVFRRGRNDKGGLGVTTPKEGTRWSRLGWRNTQLQTAQSRPTLFRRGSLTAATIRPKRLKEGLHLGQLRRKLIHPSGQSWGPASLGPPPRGQRHVRCRPLRRSRSLSRWQRILLDRDCPVSRLLHRGQPGQPHRSGQNAAIRGGMIRKRLPEMVNTKAGRAREGTCHDHPQDAHQRLSTT